MTSYADYVPLVADSHVYLQIIFNVATNMASHLGLRLTPIKVSVFTSQKKII